VRQNQSYFLFHLYITGDRKKYNSEVVEISTIGVKKSRDIIRRPKSFMRYTKALTESPLPFQEEYVFRYCDKGKSCKLAPLVKRCSGLD
jgi:hypothetical protein